MVKQETAMSIIPRAHTLPPDLERDCTWPGQGLYVCLSNLQAIVTLLQFSDSPFPPPFSFFTKTPSPSPHHLQLRFCSSLSSSPPLRVLLSPLLPLHPCQGSTRGACIPGHPFLEQTACPLFSTSGRLDAKIIYVFIFPSPPNPPCLFSFLPPPPPSSPLMGANG